MITENIMKVDDLVADADLDLKDLIEKLGGVKSATYLEFKRMDDTLIIRELENQIRQIDDMVVISKLVSIVYNVVNDSYIPNPNTIEFDIMRTDISRADQAILILAWKDVTMVKVFMRLTNIYAPHENATLDLLYNWLRKVEVDSTSSSQSSDITSRVDHGVEGGVMIDQTDSDIFIYQNIIDSTMKWCRRNLPAGHRIKTFIDADSNGIDMFNDNYLNGSEGSSHSNIKIIATVLSKYLDYKDPLLFLDHITLPDNSANHGIVILPRFYEDVIQTTTIFTSSIWQKWDIEKKIYIGVVK